VGVLPKLAGHFEGINPGLLPPDLLVSGPVNRPVVGAAQRDSELIAGLAAQRPRLHKSDVMGV
jgi:hypothetical protein